jgi:GcrA cell cycle regulator
MDQGPPVMKGKYKRDNSWPPEHDAALRRLRAANLGSEEIAASINAEFGSCYSHNAVLGRAHRLKLPPPEKPKKTDKHTAPAPMAVKRICLGIGAQVQAIHRGPKITKDLPATAVDISALDIRLVDMTESQCRAATIRVDDEWRFCGHPKQAGSSYCALHHAIYWTPRVAPTHQRPHFRARAA